ncbi:hypothetical protein THYS13_15060 [Thermoanaerobacter sp. YS13]|uniref:hypothetical protein n=1 Tax=Thermoanaerobacter sp. YS13 TaxID=1511746 RepID=UPI000573A4B3|nr:hypothetical protein [Thermoanaerobacter sp. YS13]KHO63380.1 hypothetical protein THYS13_15060 [Thermoanaerobacter sp. YS13]
MDIPKREQEYQELFKLLNAIEKLPKEQQKFYQTIFKKKFDVLYREFDIWLTKVNAELDKKIEEQLKRKENV